MAYTRAEEIQIDARQALENRGWNWGTVFPYLSQIRGSSNPRFSTSCDWSRLRSSYHGTSGFLKAGYAYSLINGIIGNRLNDTYNNIGIEWSHDVNSGKMHGFTEHPKTIDQAANVREDAA